MAQGNINGVRNTDTIKFIYRSKVPYDREVTYAIFVLDVRPLNDEQILVCITVGGERQTYPDDAGSPAANMMETKILINSTISDTKKGSRFMCANIKDHFFATPMDCPEYMQVKYIYFPPDIRENITYRTSQHKTNTSTSRLNDVCMTCARHQS